MSCVLPCECREGGSSGRCGGEACVSIAERLDCQTPDMKSCLDRVCPSKQVLTPNPRMQLTIFECPVEIYRNPVTTIIST